MNRPITYTAQNGVVSILLCERIDTNNAESVEAEIQKILADTGVQNPIFDADELSYISSAGLRVLMRVRKKAGKALEIVNVSPQVYEILDTTGFTEIFNVSKQMRKISVDGCKVIGKGFYGTVYRIDEETIVKVYASADSLSMIRNEKRLAKTALIAGVPTAISYDIVRVGDSYGSMFELLRAKTFNDLLIEHPEDADAIIRQYAQFLRLVNSSEVPAGKLESAKQKCLSYLDTAAKYLKPETVARVRTLLEAIPEQHNVIHGDAQMKNVMLADGEPMLIDMDTLSEGHPIFDLQSIYVSYFAFEEDEPTNSMDFLGIPTELATKVWEDTIRYYFDTEDAQRLESLRSKIEVVGCVRFLYLIDLIGDPQTDLFKIRIKHTVERLERLLQTVDSLLFD